MKRSIGRDHPLYAFFRELVHDAVAGDLRGRQSEDVEAYIAGLLLDFVSTDGVYAVRDRQGQRLASVYEMMAEADVRLNADSFEREREVHKHIGDYILFWSGVHPDYLRRLRLDDGREFLCDYTRQGKASYHVVSTFDYAPYDAEAPTFRKLSDGFEELAWALGRVRRHLPWGMVS